VVTPKLGDHGLLALLNNEKTRGQPNQENNTASQTKAQPCIFERRLESTTVGAAAMAAFAKQMAEFAVQVAPQLVQVRGALRGWRTTGLLGSATLSTFLATLLGRIHGLRAIVCSAPAAVIQIEHAAHALSCRIENSRHSPHQAEQSTENGPSPGFVVHVQSVKFKLQAAIVPKAKWG
jgi:hypothetical protein